LGEGKQEQDGREVARRPDAKRDPHTPGGNRRIIVISAIAVAVVVLLGGSYLTMRGGRLFGGGSPSSSSELQVKTGDPNVVAAPGEKLRRVLTPPRQTRTEIRLSKDLGRPVFSVEFQPYGLAQNGTAVVRITKASSQGGTAYAAPFAKTLMGQNVQVSLALDSRAVLQSGGVFSGSFTLVDHSGIDSFAISGVKRIK
jgi:hypothetical protein